MKELTNGNPRQPLAVRAGRGRLANLLQQGLGLVRPRLLRRQLHAKDNPAAPGKRGRVEGLERRLNGGSGAPK